MPNTTCHEYLFPTKLPLTSQVVALACIFLATKVESGVKGRAADLIQVDYALRRKKKYESMKALISKLKTNKKPRQDDPAFKVPSPFICLYPYMISAQSVCRSRLRMLILDKSRTSLHCVAEQVYISIPPRVPIAGVLGAKRPTSYLRAHLDDDALV